MGKVYLFLTEWGDFSICRTVEKDDLKAVDAGIMDILDISNPESTTIYEDGQWIGVEEYERK